MSRVFQAESFISYNRFYGRPHCRQVVMHLYDRRCASCDRPIDGENFHVAHIISRSHPDLMEKYFSGLDVDNLLNLKLSCPLCNYKESNFVLDALLLQSAFNCSAKFISLRLESVLTKLQATVRLLEMNGADPKICTDVLYIDVDEVRSFASDWHGAVTIAKPDLDTRVRDAIMSTFGEEADHMAVYYAVKEATSYFHDHLKIDGRSFSFKSAGNRPWLVKAYKHLYSESRGAQPLAEAVQAAGLIDGDYLDPNELDERGGLLIPLRTESQRWFHEVFATILWTQRKLEKSSNKRYLALGEHEWNSLCRGFKSLSLIEPSIGKIGRRLKAPDIVANFGLCSDELRFDDEDLKISEEVRRMCQAVATDSIWGEGALVHKSKLKPWLARAFSMADQAAQQVTGPHLIRIGDEQTQYRWVPPLPNVVGKTRDEVRLEASSLSVRRERRRKSQQSA